MPETPKDRPVVMISSTVSDLPEHRREVMDACLRQGMFPVMMEHLPASDADAKQVSEELVNKADIYLGIFAHQYGYVPAGYDLSVTEMEYNRAVERDIPRLIFIMHEEHPLKAAGVETGGGAIKLKGLKARVAGERVVNFFKSPEDLRAHAINSLSQHRKRDPMAFHYVCDIPAPPEAYVAHPYTLMQTKALVGRQAELEMLNRWVSSPHDGVYQSRILNIVSIGGVGKSALTWKWFSDIALEEVGPLAGRMWWSFYESDANFENFVIRALAYVSRRNIEEIKKISPFERETQLLSVLDREPFLIVLDGLERITIAYARMDGPRLADEGLDEATANLVAGELGLPESAAESFVSGHRLRKTADPRAGAFLRKLCGARAARVLVSTRLYPAELQTSTGYPVPGSFAYFLGGLSDEDALSLWRASQVTGSREALLPLFHTFDNHALLIQALASEVAYYRRAPGDFDRWRRDHPEFNPFSLPLNMVKSHVLAFALRGLEDVTREVLQLIAAFRMAATYDTLTAILVGEESLFVDETSFISAITELEDRGLLGWDKRANRYDLHPIVRGVIWSALNTADKRGIYESLQQHFESLPAIEDWRVVNGIEDLTTTIELYNTLIGQESYQHAVMIFYDRLEEVTLYRLSASRQRIELLELLFPDGLHRPPQPKITHFQAFVLGALATSYDVGGEPRRAVPMYRHQIAIYKSEGPRKHARVSLCNLAISLYHSGALHEAEAAARRAWLIARNLREPFEEAIALRWIGIVMAARGLADWSEVVLQQALLVFELHDHPQAQGVMNAFLAQQMLWRGDPSAAQTFAANAWELAQHRRHERDLVRAGRLQGAVALGLGESAAADEYFHYALTSARAINFVAEEAAALIGMAELRQRVEPGAARDILEDAWEHLERGPYPLAHADACNVLALIERDAGNRAAAQKAAREAFRKAWCDGPPFAYHWGLEKARGVLRELGAEEPLMPAFDESKFEAMPEVEIDPPDEFGSQKGERAGGGKGRKRRKR